MFIGREKELANLSNTLSSNKFEAVLVYGIRRVGKTLLVNEAVKSCSKKVFKVECIHSSIEENILLFTKRIRDAFNEPYISFDSFSDIFDYLFAKSLETDLIIIIDEFSFLLEEDFSVESMLAVAIDEYKDKTSLKLIILGSYIGILQRMTEYSSHCYGRFTSIMHIKPFNYYEASLFYPSYSNEDKIMLYSVLGGIPFFNSLVDTSISALDNILNLVVRKDSILEHEIKEMFFSETRKISSLNELISIIGRGVNKYSDIVKMLSKNKSSNPSYLIERLIDMNIIKKEFPINNETNKKKTFYKFDNNLINFYFRYLHANPYQEYREEPDVFFDQFIKNDFFKQYLPHKFEDISKEFLLKLNLKKKLNPFALKIGSYSFDDSKNRINREFDVVTLDEKGYISYECKYTDSPLDNKVIQEEENQIKGLDISFYKLGFISKSGFKDDIDKSKYNLFTINDFYKDY